MMNVLYDNQIFLSQRYGGISRYFIELILAFSKDISMDVNMPVVCTNNNYLYESKLYKINNYFYGKKFFGKTTLNKYITNILTILSQQNKKFDIFHPTYYDPYFLKYIGNKPFVITVHDLTYELYPDFFDDYEIVVKWKEETIRRASKLIAISECTKKDLIRIYGIDEDKVAVIYHGNSIGSFNLVPHSLSLPSRYLLFVGARGGYKNFSFFVKAVSSLVREESDLYIVCTGGGQFTFDELALFDELHVREKIIQYSVSDESLAYIYSNALAFVFPSLYEGFGIPILEAFNCGCPAILSNTSSLPEVGGEAALYFDPTDELSICNAVEMVTNNSDLCTKLINAGYKRNELFSWEMAAQSTKELYLSTVVQNL